MIYDFVKSDLGILISWGCTVFGFCLSIFFSMKCKKLKREIKECKLIASSGGGDFNVNSSGGKNVYTKNLSGGMNVKM